MPTNIFMTVLWNIFKIGCLMVWMGIQSIRYPILMSVLKQMKKMVEMCIQV